VSVWFSPFVGARWAPQCAGHTRQDGTVVLRSIDMYVRGVSARAHGFAPGVRLVTVGADPPAMLSLDIALDEGAVLCGRVITDAGDPVPGACISIKPELSYPESMVCGSSTARSEASGLFRIDSLIAAPLRLTTEPPPDRTRELGSSSELLTLP